MKALIPLFILIASSNVFSENLNTENMNIFRACYSELELYCPDGVEERKVTDKFKHCLNVYGRKIIGQCKLRWKKLAEVSNENIKKAKTKITKDLKTNPSLVPLGSKPKLQVQYYDAKTKSEIKSYCVKDVDLYCREYIEDKQKLIKCIEKNSKKFTPECQKELG